MCAPRSRPRASAPSWTWCGCPTRPSVVASPPTSASPEMRAFLAVSVAAQAAPRWRGQVQAAMACLADDDTKVDRVDESTDGWLAFAGTDGDDLLGDPGQPLTVRLSRLLRTRDTDLTTAEVGARLAAG